MLFARAASFFLAALTFGLSASANPVADAEKRAVSPQTIVNNLQTTVSTIMPQLKGITTNTPANSAKAESLVNQLVSAMNSANTQAQTASVDKRRGTDAADAAIAAVLASVVTVVAEGLTPVVHLIPALGPLIVTVDVALNTLVVSLDVVVVGLSVALSSLLLSVSGVLSSLGFSVLLLTLGL